MNNSENTKLPVMYRCCTVVEKFGNHSDVTLMFFHCGSKRSGGVIIPYDQAIEDYYSIPEDNRTYSESAIDEMFLLDEVLALEEYLAKYYKSVLEYSEVKLPIENNIAGFSCQAFGGGLGIGDLEMPSRIYTLDFSVMYGYNLQMCECPYCFEQERLYPRGGNALEEQAANDIKSNHDWSNDEEVPF